MADRPFFRRRLVVMAREPRAGAVKSRLASGIGAVRATAFYRHTLVNVTARLARDPRWRTLLAVTPDTAIASPVWPGGTGVVGQGGGDLGERMQAVFDRLPPGPAVIVGTDIPQISPSHVARAFDALGGHDAVLGPADDGGYWLVGLKRAPKVPSVFSGVRWSSPHALADTLGNLDGLRIAMLETLADVDDERSHRRLASAGGRRILPAYGRDSRR